MISGHNVFLEMKRLTLSSPEYVYAYLESHADKDLPWGFSEALHQMNNSLVNLGLARYSNNINVLRTLFRNPPPQEEEALRCAVLSNPNCDFSLSIAGCAIPLEKKELQDVLEQGTDWEILALVSNKSLQERALADIFDRTGWAQTLSHDRWAWCAFYALTWNSNLKKQFQSHFTVGYSSGWEFYEHGTALKAAWKVLESAPLSEVWALRLGSVFGNKSIASHHSCDDAFFQRVLERWKSDDPQLEKSFGELRMSVAANVPPQSQLHEWMATQDDLSVRCGHYYSFDTDDPEELIRCFDRDGHKFIEAAISNDNLYRQEHVRDRFRKLIDRDGNKNGHWLYLDVFVDRLKRLGQKDPRYLSTEEKREREADLPVTMGTLRQVIEELEEHLLNRLDRKIAKLKRSLF